MYRWATPTDHEALGQVFHDAIHKGDMPYTQAQRKAWAPKAPHGPEWSARLVGQSVVIVDEGVGIMGFMSLTSEGYVDFAYLLEAARGQGHFRAMFARLEELARRKGLDRMTTHASLRAQGPFTALGFVVTRHETVERRGESLKRACMTYDLTGSRRADRLTDGQSERGPI